MEDMLTRLFENLADRLAGPLHFRLLLQPATAIFFAIRDGMKDARDGRSAYLWSMFSNPDQRQYLIKEGWASIARVFTLAVIMDVVYQLYALRWFYPLETVIVAVTLAVVPYLVLRGPVNRIAQAWKGHAAPPSGIRGAK